MTASMDRLHALLDAYPRSLTCDVHPQDPPGHVTACGCIVGMHGQHIADGPVWVDQERAGALLYYGWSRRWGVTVYRDGHTLIGMERAHRG